LALIKVFIAAKCGSRKQSDARKKGKHSFSSMNLVFSKDLYNKTMKFKS